MSCLFPYRLSRFMKNSKRPQWDALSYLATPANMDFVRTKSAYASTQSKADLSQYTLVPCNKCVECCKRYTRDLSIRMYMESLSHKHSLFLTLTYSPENLPSGGSLTKRDPQLFLKRLRKRLGSSCKIRYVLCGEYGDKGSRPHYHAVIYGLDPLNPSVCKYIEESWTLGFVHIGKNVSISAMRYLAKYVSKKRSQASLYSSLDLLPPFLLSSRRNGIGYAYVKANFARLRSRVANKVPFLVVSGFRYYFPKYVMKLLFSASELFDMWHNFIYSNLERLYSSLRDRFFLRPDFYFDYAMLRTYEHRLRE